MYDPDRTCGKEWCSSCKRTRRKESCPNALVELLMNFYSFMFQRMGLEALVESYAFWRPSLRTLTFEDIPGMAKQGEAFLIITSPTDCTGYTQVDTIVQSFSFLLSNLCFCICRSPRRSWRSRSPHPHISMLFTFPGLPSQSTRVHLQQAYTPPASL